MEHANQHISYGFFKKTIFCLRGCFNSESFRSQIRQDKKKSAILAMEVGVIIFDLVYISGNALILYSERDKTKIRDTGVAEPGGGLRGL